MTGCKKRLFLILAVSFVFMFGIMSITNADSIAEKVQAYLGVKVTYNGQELKADKQPYIINDTTYVPLRMLMDNFGKDITYDKASNKVVIKDKYDASVAALNSKITTLQNENSKLQSQITTLKDENAKLKTENATLTTKNTTLTNRIAALQNDDDDELSEIEDDLYDDYEDAGDEYFDDEDIEVDITLDGDEDDVDIEIYLDFSDSDKNDDLSDLSLTKIKSLLLHIYNDTEDYLEDSDDYDKADLIGIIEDDDENYIKYDGSTYKDNF